MLRSQCKLQKNSAKENFKASKGPVQKVFEKAINKAIAESGLSLKDVSNLAQKYKNIQNYIKLRLKIKYQKINYQIKLMILILKAIR